MLNFRKPFPCPKCDKAFRTNYHLKAHDVTQHVQENTSFSCGKCRRKLSSKEAFEKHSKVHTANDDEKPFMCSKCNKGTLIKKVSKFVQTPCANSKK